MERFVLPFDSICDACFHDIFDDYEDCYRWKNRSSLSYPAACKQSHGITQEPYILPSLYNLAVRIYEMNDCLPYMFPAVNLTKNRYCWSVLREMEES